MMCDDMRHAAASACDRIIIVVLVHGRRHALTARTRLARSVVAGTDSRRTFGVIVVGHSSSDMHSASRSLDVVVLARHHAPCACHVRRSTFEVQRLHSPRPRTSIIDDHARAWIATSPQRPRGAAGQRGDRSIHRCRSIDRSIDRSIGPSIHRSVHRSVHRSIGPSVHRSIDPSRPGGRKAEWLTAGTGARGTEDEDDRRRGPTRI